MKRLRPTSVRPEGTSSVAERASAAARAVRGSGRSGRLLAGAVAPCSALKRASVLAAGAAARVTTV